MRRVMKRIMRELDHTERDKWGFEVLVLACGHRFQARHLGGRPEASQHRRRQYCPECTAQHAQGEAPSE